MNFAPPTDSLYKFTAIIGSIIVILSFYVPVKALSSFNQQVIDRRLSSKIIKLELSELDSKIKRLENIRDDNIAKNKKGYKLDPSKLHIYYSNEEIKQMAEQIISDLGKISIKRAELDSIEEKIEYADKELRYVRILLILGSLLGYFLALYGYVNWYRKIQVYQDKMLKQTVEDDVKK